MRILLLSSIPSSDSLFPLPKLDRIQFPSFDYLEVKCLELLYIQGLKRDIFQRRIIPS